MNTINQPRQQFLPAHQGMDEEFLQQTVDNYAQSKQFALCIEYAMSVTYIPVALRRLVEERAKQRCEYCQLPAGVAFFSHEVDHVIAEKHGGTTEEGNLAYTCWRCNRYKGSDLGSFDP